MPAPTSPPVFFSTPEELRDWLDANHATAAELWVGFHKKGSGLPSITWQQAVDEALCFGWIDGIRKSIDERSYTNRLTPRRARSNWSAVNVARFAELTREGRVRPAGLAAFEKRAPERSGIYAYENRKQAELDPESEAAFRAVPEAWDFFQARPEGYRKTAIWWVITGKREETRRKRFARLIETSREGRTVGLFDRSDRGQP